MADRNLALQLLITARDQASAGLDRIRGGLSAIGSAVSEALAPLKTFTGLIGAAIGVGGAKELVDRADSFTRLSNQLRVASQGEQDYRDSLGATVAVAKSANAALDSTAALYGKIKQNADDLNISQQQVADVTETVAKGMQLSGASTEAASGATLQFTQSLASGVLRGDEFNSVMEASPALIKAIADGLGVTVGEMRALAEAGQLTSSRVVQALLSQKQAIDETYGKLPQTAGQAFQQLDNAATLFAGRLNEQLGATRALGDGLGFLANNLDAVAALIGAGLAAAVARGTTSLVQHTQATLAARAAVQEQAVAAAQQTAANVAAAEGHVAAAQAAYNQAAAEQRAALAMAAQIEATFGLVAGEEAIAAARAQATAAANAAAAASQRYAAAQAALNALQAPAAASAGLFARTLGFLAGPGGLVLAAVAGFTALYALFAKGKPATDAIAQSTEQYAASLRKLTAAQTQVELDKINQVIAEQRQQVNAARSAYDQAANSQKGWVAVTEDLGPVLGEVTRVISDSAEISRVQAERQAALDAATATLAETEQRRAAVLNELDAKQQTVSAGTAGLVVAALQQATAMDKAAKSTQDYRKYLDERTNAEQKATQAALEQATAEQNLNEVERLTIQLAQQRADAAQKQAQLAQLEATAAQLKVRALEQQQAAQGKLSVVDAAALEQARQLAEVKQAEADAAKGVGAQLANEAGQTKNLHITRTALLDGASKFLAAQQAMANAAVREAQAALELARAKGNEKEIREATVNVAQKEIAALEALRKSQQGELQELGEKLQRLVDEAGGYDKLTAAQRLSVDALKQEAEAKRLDIKTSDEQIQKLQEQSEWYERVGKVLAAAGADDLEIKRQQLLASGQFTAALKIEAEQRKRNAATAREEASASEDAAAAKEKEAAAAQEQAAAQKEAAYQAEQAAARTAEKVVYAAKSFDQLNAKGEAALKAIATGYDTAHGSIEQLNRAILEETQALDGAAGAEIAAAKRLERLQDAAAGIGPAAEHAQAALADMAAGASGMTAITAAGERVISTLKSIQQQAISARQALSEAAVEFDEEILRIQGNQRELLEREHKANLERLAELRRQGGFQSEAEYQEAVRRANALHKLKLQQLREEQEERNRSGGTASGGSGSRGGSGISGGGGVSSGGSSTTINIHVDGKDLLSEEQIRRKIIPFIDRATRLRS